MSLQSALESVFGPLKTQEVLPVTPVAPVTRTLVTGENIIQKQIGNRGNSGNRSKSSDCNAKRELPVAKSEPVDEDWFDERKAMAISLGGVPQRYAAGFAKLQAHRPDNVPSSDWLQALNDAGMFLDTWGSQAAKLGWSPADLFEWVPTGCCGLIWELRGRQVVALTEDGAAIGEDENSVWSWFARFIGGQY